MRLYLEMRLGSHGVHFQSIRRLRGRLVEQHRTTIQDIHRDCSSEETHQCDGHGSGREVHGFRGYTSTSMHGQRVMRRRVQASEREGSKADVAVPSLLSVEHTGDVIAESTR